MYTSLPESLDMIEKVVDSVAVGWGKVCDDAQNIFLLGCERGLIDVTVKATEGSD
jgi:hypothetical protein